MGFWKSLFGGAEAPAIQSIEVASVMGDSWVSHCAGMCKSFSPDATHGMQFAPQFELCCPDEETAIALAQYCNPYVLNMLSRDLSVRIYEDGLASVQFWPDLSPEMHALNAETVWKMVDLVFKSPGYEGRSVVIQNGYVFPTNAEGRTALMEITRAGPDHAIVVGDAFVW